MKLTIGFYTEGLPFNGNTLYERALGGSESALTYMAAALAARGHRVIVFCRCDKPGKYGSVLYHDISEAMNFRRIYDFDVWIVSRFAGALNMPVRAGLRVLWNHDILTPETKDGIIGSMVWCDLAFCLSDYHKGQWLSLLPEIAPILQTTTNGVDLEYLDAAVKRTQKKPNRFIYSSRPERGLLVLLRDIWPRVRREMPDAVLGLCGYDITGMEVIPQLKQLYDYIAKLTAETPGVEILGALNKKQLYRKMAEAKLILYPTAFPEISPVRGDTLIETLNGARPIQELVGKSGFQVYSCDVKGKTSISTVKGVFLTRQSTPMMRLVYKTGVGCKANVEASLCLTPDHEVMLRDGTYRRADELIPGDRINAFGRSKNDWAPGYDSVGVTNDLYHPEHRFVAEKMRGCSLERGEVVHHVNGDTRDCRFENLAITVQAEHRRGHWLNLTAEEYAQTCAKHRESVRAFQERIGAEATSDLRRKAACKAWATMHAWPDAKLQAYLEYRQSRRTPEGIERARKTTQSRMDAMWGGAPWRDAAGVRRLYWEEGLSTTEIAAQMGTSNGTISHWLRRHGFGARSLREAQLIRRRSLVSNHIVVSCIAADPADGYCMAVEPDHNFIANGIVVHNCLTAIEGQAIGTPILTTAAFALAETVADKRCLISGHNESKEYQDAYCSRLFEILKDDVLYGEIVANGRKHVEDRYQWKNVAKDWERRFLEYMQNRIGEYAEGVTRELVRIGDLAACPASEAIMERIAYARKPESEDPLAEQNPNWAANDQRCMATRDSIAAFLAKNGGAEGKRLLDLGSNNGAVTVYLGNEFPALQIIGYDLNNDACKLAYEYRNVHAKPGHHITDFITGGIDEVLEGQKPFDILFAGELIEHIEDTSDFLEKCRAAVKPGGLMIFTFPYGTRQCLWNGDPTPDDPKTRKPAHPAHFHYFDYGDILDIFGEQRELQIIRIAPEHNLAGEEFGNGAVAFRNSKQPFGKRNLERRRLTTRPYQSLTLSMIAKNEEDNLSRCLKSLYRICDQIRFHDTGSTDGTPAIARRFTEAITEHPFQDFGDSRNRSIEGATGDWILWVDADEVTLWPENIRKYLQTKLFNGFVIAQNHLMVDVPGTKDLPVRIFRNGKGYRFTGTVHEHCEDVNLGPFDNAISPAIALPDVHLAHTGYLCEAIRRDKCRRNYPFLLEDLRRNPDRMLNKVLDARDCLNFVGWEYEAAQGKITPRIVGLCRRVIAIHREHFTDPANKYHALSDGQYQRALGILGQAGVPGADNEKLPPLELEIGLGAGIGGLRQDAHLKNHRRWFLNREDVMEYVARKALELEKALP